MAKAELFTYNRILTWLVRHAGAFAVRRGESDLEALRLARRVLRAGHPLGVFCEGTRQPSEAIGKVQPGAALIALAEGAPIVPVVIQGTIYIKKSLRHPVTVMFGPPLQVSQTAQRGRAYRDAVVHDDGGAAERAGAPPAPDAGRDRRRAAARPRGRGCGGGLVSDDAPRSRSSRQRTAEAEAATERTLLGTVAIVGEPNAGKSTLVNRLTATRETVVHSEPGVTRDRKQMVVEWGGDLFALIDTGGVDAGDEGPFQSEIVRQAELAISEADLVLLLVDATTSPGPADLELADRLRRSRVPGSARRQQARQPGPPRRGARVPRARPRRSVRALGAARHRHRRPARRDRRAAARARRGARRAHDRRDRRRHPRPPERRQVVAAQRALRRGPHDRRARSPGRRATRSTSASSARTASTA